MISNQLDFLLLVVRTSNQMSCWSHWFLLDKRLVNYFLVCLLTLRTIVFVLEKKGNHPYPESHRTKAKIVSGMVYVRAHENSDGNLSRLFTIAIILRGSFYVILSCQCHLPLTLHLPFYDTVGPSRS